MDEVVKEGDISRVVIDERQDDPFFPEDGSGDDEEEEGETAAAGTVEEPALVAQGQAQEEEEVERPGAVVDKATKEAAVENERQGDDVDHGSEKRERRLVVQGGWLDGLEEAVL